MADVWCGRCKRIIHVGDECQERVCNQERFFDGGTITVTRIVLFQTSEAK